MTEQQIKNEKILDKLFKEQLRKFVKENPDFMKNNVMGFSK